MLVLVAYALVITNALLFCWLVIWIVYVDVCEDDLLVFKNYIVYAWFDCWWFIV